MSEITEHLYRKAARQNLPIAGTFEVTPVCNFNCSMCYVRMDQEEIRKAGSRQLKLEDWLRIAKEAREEGMLYLLLTGGEPLGWPDFWKLYDELIDMGLIVSINTNGSLIDEEAVKRFLDRPPRRVNITLYGASDETYERLCSVRGQYQKVCEAVISLKEAGINVKLNCSLTPDNKEDLERITAFGREHQVPVSINTYMFPPVRKDRNKVGVNHRFTPKEAAYWNLEGFRMTYGEERCQTYFKRICESGTSKALNQETGYGRMACRAGRAAFWVTWDGYLSGCGMMASPKVEILDFPSAWKELNSEISRIEVSGICSRCSDRWLCHSCAAMAAAETGKTEKIPGYLCQMVREMKKLASGEESLSREEDID